MIQFHPTLLGKPGQTYGLVSEAVRGHGGILVNSLGEVTSLGARLPKGCLSSIKCSPRLLTKIPPSRS